MTIAVAIVGTILVFIGGLALERQRSQRQRCTLYTQARVCQVSKTDPQESHLDAPVALTYYIDEALYRAVNKSCKKGLYAAGQVVSLLVDPNNPNEFCEVDDNKSRRVPIVLLLVGGIIMLVTIPMLAMNL